ncbi:MAG TPA: twin-arginine translocase subunit TatC [Candidatus Angelobacter sp.]|jgi:sec-independent protein translocase protein TatC|nr:twin-arginine translocase subunit TatC [Candidatus Angelobacter sp.]
MSVIEHLEALRRMLIVIIVAWAVTTIAAFFVSGQVVEWLVSRAGLGKAIYLGPGSFVLTRLQVALYIGFIVAAPVVIQQIWWFVSPGLHRHERRLTLPLIVATIFFFGLGVAAALYALPLYIRVLNSFAPPNVTYLADVAQLVGFILLMVIGFGVVFELPVVLVVLGFLGIISSKWLYKNRVWWFLALALVANFLTPGVDPLTPLLMFVPLYIFFEASAIILKLSGR